MKTLSVSTVIASAFLLATWLPASAAPGGPVPTAPGQNKLQCFDGTTDTANADPAGSYGPYGGICTLTSKGAKGPATLDNTVLVGSGDYAGVYVFNSNLNGKPIGQIDHLSFIYIGTPTNGSPRITLPIDTTGDGVLDDYLSISAYWCNDGAGLVDAIHDSTCIIFLNSNGTTPVGQNWAEMVAAHPTWTITNDSAFVIADDPGIWTVYNVTLGKPGK